LIVLHRSDAMQDQSTSSSGSGTGQEQRIDATFRNGSITAVGIILGFSLSFLSQCASNPIAWSRVDAAAAVPLVLGIVLQAVALADLLSVRSLIASKYERARMVFLAGLALVAAGIGVAIILDILGLGPRTLAP
jgi:hypothetical protein